MTQRLERLLETLEGHRVFVQTHNFPDPDAIASAFGLQKLLGHFGIEAKICYHGSMGKASVQGIITMFGVDVTEIDEINGLSADDYVVTVDSQINNSNVRTTKATVVGCIDHHPTTSPFTYKFRDVRICGSCCTLVAEYFFSNEIDMDMDTATCLLYGLKMDTENFNRGVTDLDIEIYRELFALADKDKLKTISNHQMAFEDLNIYRKALGTVKVYDGIAFSFIDGEASDGLVAAVSDFLLTLVEVQFSVTYAYRGNGLKLSARSELDYLDAGNILANALEGIGTGGGHQTMAGGYISFDDLGDVEFDLQEEIQNRFINAVYFSRAIREALNDPFADVLLEPAEQI